MQNNSGNEFFEAANLKSKLFSCATYEHPFSWESYVDDASCPDIVAKTGHLFQLTISNFLLK